MYSAITDKTFLKGGMSREQRGGALQSEEQRRRLENCAICLIECYFVGKWPFSSSKSAGGQRFITLILRHSAGWSVYQ